MHARSRKVPLAPASSEDEIGDTFPPDDAAGMEVADRIESAEVASTSRKNEAICLACGGDGSRHEGCDHAEVARLHEPSRAAGEMIARLRAAAAEHRAASRALRALVTSELSRDRADLTTKRPVAAPVAALAEGSPAPCARCAEREADGAGAVIPLVRAGRKRGRPAVTQQSLPFGRGPVPATGSVEEDDDPGERTIERLLV